MVSAGDIATLIESGLLARNGASREFFDREAERLARACRQMADRFSRGGRLLAFGRGAHATDAQHVSVEFVHPVIVGKRALPALDLSAAFQPWLQALLRPEDMVMGFGPPERDAAIQRAMTKAGGRGAMVFSLPGPPNDEGGYAVEPPSPDPFIHQELIEILYHTLWETVHVFLESGASGGGPTPNGRSPQGGADQKDVGASAFLYPFLSGAAQEPAGLLAEVAASIADKAGEDERLRRQVADGSARSLAEAVPEIGERLRAGGKLIAFGNGGSATDANDLALDCVAPPSGLAPLAAVSLAMESPNISAIANDVGAELVFSRQLIAHARPEDVAVAFSTSGGSANVVTALEEARRRGLFTLALLGNDGGEVVRRGLPDLALVVPSDYVPRIQEVQASVYHVLRGVLEHVRPGDYR
jgi:D-sedoheptulose 7-phosphate isomerase